MPDALYNNIYNPDVLSCLANLSNDEVFTPPNIANAMLDMLPQELFSNPDTTFLDVACKSGIFLREIAKRLLKGLEPQIPDLQERINHIFTKQLYGIAITELTSLLSRRSLYCSKYPNSKYSVVPFDNSEGNIRFRQTQHTWVTESGRTFCKYCGVNKETVLGSDERGVTLESHAYEFIHTEKPEEIFNMKFDVVVSNPPYQMSDGGSGTGISAIPIYHFFVQQAKKLNPRYITMIIPSRWFSGGKGLDAFRDEMLKDKRIETIIDFMSSKDCFPGVNIAGGVNYFLWSREHKGNCIVKNCAANMTSIVAERQLDEFDVFIRDNRALSIIHKFLDSHDISLAEKTFTRNPFGFVSKERGAMRPIPGIDNVILISSGGIGYVKRESVIKNKDEIDRFKVTIGKIVPSNGEVDTDPEDGYKVITSSHILRPGEIHTESYLLLRTFDTELEAKNFAKFMALKFPRFMMKHTLTSMNISTQNFIFVPFLDCSQQWTDDILYERYKLSKEERAYIEAIIRPMDLTTGDNSDAE